MCACTSKQNEEHQRKNDGWHQVFQSRKVMGILGMCGRASSSSFQPLFGVGPLLVMVLLQVETQIAEEYFRCSSPKNRHPSLNNHRMINSSGMFWITMGISRRLPSSTFGCTRSSRVAELFLTSHTSVQVEGDILWHHCLLGRGWHHATSDGVNGIEIPLMSLKRTIAPQLLQFGQDLRLQQMKFGHKFTARVHAH